MFKVKVRGIDQAIYANSRLTTDLSKRSKDLSKDLCTKILYASYYYVPQDTNTLLKSGKVTETKAGYGRVVYDATNRQRMDALLQRGTFRDIQYAEELSDSENLDESYASIVEFDDTIPHKNGQAHFLQRALEDVLSKPDNTYFTLSYYGKEIPVKLRIDPEAPIEDLKSNIKISYRRHVKKAKDKERQDISSFQDKHPELAEYAITKKQIQRIKSDITRMKNREYVRLKPWMEGTRFEDARTDILDYRARQREKALDEKHRPILGPVRPVGRPNKGLTEQHKYKKVSIDKRKNVRSVNEAGEHVILSGPGEQKRKQRRAHGRAIEKQLHQIRSILKKSETSTLHHKKTGAAVTEKELKTLRKLASKLANEQDYRYLLHFNWYVQHTRFKGSK